MLARFFRGHAELVLGGPAFYARDCCAWPEPVVHRFVVKPNVNLDVTAAVEVRLEAGRADVLAHDHGFIERQRPQAHTHKLGCRLTPKGRRYLAGMFVKAQGVAL